MSKLIRIVNELSEEEYFIVEMQGSISHNNENKFYNLNLGRIESISKVFIKYLDNIKQRINSNLSLETIIYWAKGKI